MNIQADVRIRVELWVDSCRKCMTKHQSEYVNQLREKINNDMEIAAMRVLRKHKDVEVKFL